MKTATLSVTEKIVFHHLIPQMYAHVSATAQALCTSSVGFSSGSGALQAQIPIASAAKLTMQLTD